MRIASFHHVANNTD